MFFVRSDYIYIYLLLKVHIVPIATVASAAAVKANSIIYTELVYTTQQYYYTSCLVLLPGVPPLKATTTTTGPKTSTNSYSGTTETI